MPNKFSSWLLYKVMKWKKNVSIEYPDKFIICLAPHTSNWDFILGKLFGSAEGLKSNFLMKKDWFFWPLGILLKRMGGIPVFRDKHTSLTEILAKTAIQSKTFQLCITPEGTRSLNPDWKKGFYFIALKAQIPILLFALDYENKQISCTKLIYPSGNVEEDMKIIKSYFKDFKGKRPDQFSIGDINE